jgi:hypothetical protein
MLCAFWPPFCCVPDPMPLREGIRSVGAPQGQNSRPVPNADIRRCDNVTVVCTLVSKIGWTIAA